MEATNDHPLPKTIEEVELAVAADALKPRSLYEHFDDLSLEVMRKNNALLMREALATVAIADRPKAVLFFDVRTGGVHSDGPEHCSVDLVEACKAAWAKNGTTLPTNNLVLNSLTVSSAHSNMRQPTRLTCLNTNKVPGCFVQGTVKGKQTQAGPCLFVVEPGSSGPTGDVVVYSAGDFVTSKTFVQYNQALSKDITEQVTEVAGANCVEYMSPWAAAVECEDDDQTLQRKSDWFVQVMYNNPEAFDNPVQAVRSPKAEGEGYVVSLRVHKRDWENLMGAVSAAVIEPLYQGVINIADKEESSLEFEFKPTAHDGWESEADNACCSAQLRAEVTFV
jgi:hypothetical protein